MKIKIKNSMKLSSKAEHWPRLGLVRQGQLEFEKKIKKGENHQLQHLIPRTGKDSGWAEMKIKINNSIRKSFQARSVEDNWAQV